MKAFIAILFTISAVAAKGSGPYLPRGWRPTGPAFYLPSEVTAPADSPLKQTLEETEASGSDALREYGPPKVETAVQVEINEEVQPAVPLASQDLTNQALPDVATEQAFYTEGRSIGEVNAEVEDIQKEEEVVAVQEVNSEQLAATDDGTTESSVAEIIVDTEIEPTAAVKSIAVDEIAEPVVETTDKVVEINAEINTSQDVVEAVTAVVESATEIVQNAEQSVVEGSGSVDERAAVVENAAVVAKVAAEVNNIAETIEKLEKEVIAEVKSVQEITEINTTQEVSGSVAQVPEGFLEYGPPGFQEYGPPKQDITSAAVEIPQNVAVENNEVRRRRFSPKFRSQKKH